MHWLEQHNQGLILYWHDKVISCIIGKTTRYPTLHWQDNTMSYFALARQHNALFCVKDNTMSILLCIKDNTMSYFASKTTRCPTSHQRQRDALLCIGKTTQCPTFHQRQHDVLFCTGKTTLCPTLHQTMSYFASKTTRCPTLHQRQHDVLLCIKDNTMSYFALAKQHGVLH